MRIVIINGQNHLGSTYHLGRILAQQLAAAEEIEEFFLPRDLNHFCLGCYQCIEDVSRCPYQAEKKIILDAMAQAELLIFTTPNYCFGPSAQMKAFIDLCFDFWLSHRPLPWLRHKRAVVLSTCAGGGARAAARQVKRALLYMGLPWVRTYTAAVAAMNWETVQPEKKRKLERDLTRLAQRLSKANLRPCLKSRFLWWMFAGMHSSGWDSSPVEKQYWQEQGWIK